MKRARIYVIYGQGGWLTSIGMSRLATRLAKLFPLSVVTTHGWDDPNAIIADARQQPQGVPIILIGYSLGANCVTWVNQRAPGMPIALAVAYDPSVLSIVVNPTNAVKRLLLYHNVDNEPEGHAVFKGPQVETTTVNLWHLALCYNEALHLKTIDAVQKVVGQ